MIRYGDQVAYPAVRVVNTWCFFMEGPLTTFDRSEDFGIPGQGPRLPRCRLVKNPEAAFGPIVEKQKSDISD